MANNLKLSWVTNNSKPGVFVFVASFNLYFQMGLHYKHSYSLCVLQFCTKQCKPKKNYKFLIGLHSRKDKLQQKYYKNIFLYQSFLLNVFKLAMCINYNIYKDFLLVTWISKAQVTFFHVIFKPIALSSVSSTKFLIMWKFTF